MCSVDARVYIVITRRVIVNNFFSQRPSKHMRPSTTASLLVLIDCVSGLNVSPTYASSRRHCLALLGGCTALVLDTGAASAVYGQFAKMKGGQDQMGVGDSSNECLFAQPGTGVCQVYKSSDPPAWQSPNTDAALSKLLKAAKQLNSIGGQIDGSKWTQIGQALGSSRDLREAVGFLTAAAADPASAFAAKKVALAAGHTHITPPCSQRVSDVGCCRKA